MRFIHDTLSMDHIDLHKDVMVVMERADSEISTICDAMDLHNDAVSIKKSILQQQLDGNIKIMLTPTFINHMLNEMDFMKRILDNDGIIDDLMLDYTNKIWLLDAKGHAEALKHDLDSTEYFHMKKLKKFMKKFDKLLECAKEVKGFKRTLKEFPKQDIMHLKIEEIMNEFIDILLFLREKKASNEVLARFTILVPDHMYREEFYYLRCLGFAADDPTQPRIEM